MAASRASRAAVVCPACDTPAIERARFCGHCGARIVRHAPLAAPSADTLGPFDDSESGHRRGASAVRSPPVRPRSNQVRLTRRWATALAAVGLFAAAAVVAPELGAPRETVTASTARGGPARDGVTSDRAVTDLSATLWHHSGASQRPWPHEIPAAVAIDDVVAVAASDHLVVLDATTAQERWRAPIEAANIAGAVAGDGTVPVLTGSELLALRVATGGIAWRRPLDAAARPTSWPWAQVPLPLDGGFAARTLTGVVVVDADGGLRWRWQPVGQQWVDRLLVTDDRVIVLAGGSLVALDATDGTERWQTRLSPADRRGLSIDVHAGQVIVATADPTLLVLDATTGDRIGGAVLERRSAIADVANGVVTLVPEPIRHDAFLPQELPRHRLPSGDRIVGLPLASGSSPRTRLDVVDDGLIVRTIDTVVRSRDGERLWERALDSTGSVDVAVAGDLVLTTARNGIVALDAATGAELSRFETARRWRRGRAAMVLTGDTVVAIDAPPIDLSTGQPVQEARTQSVAGGLIATTNGVLADTETGLRSLSSRGRERWHHGTGARQAVRPLLVTDEHVVASSGPDGEEELVVLDLRDGSVLSKVSASMWPWADVAATHQAFVTWASAETDDGWPIRLQRWDLDAATGELARTWSHRAAWTGGLTIAGGRVLSVDGATVVSRDLATGRLLEPLPLPFVAESAIAVDGGVLVATDGYNVAALQLASGELLWRQRLAHPAVSDPTIAGGHLYLAHANGGVTVRRVADAALIADSEVTSSPALPAAVVVAEGVVLVRFASDLWALGPVGALGPAGGPPAGRVELPTP